MSTSEQCAVLFADLAGSTGVYERLGDVAAKKLVDACLDRLTRNAQDQQGVVIKTIGDELMLRFPSADCAAQAAMTMQQQNRDVQSPFSLRIGFHFGPVIHQNNDVFGDAVNTAARLAQLARNGQILTSEESVQRLDVGRKENARPFDFDKLRGKSQAIRIFELVWEHAREVTKLIGSGEDTSPSAPIEITRSIRLTARHQERRFSPQDAPITIGRESICMFTLASEFASRVHVHIEYRRGKFVLMDRSTNGTYVTPEGDTELFLKGETLHLSRSGIISLGSPLLSQTGEVLRYTVE
jgi:class 3 adenylate cyclase